MRHPLRVLWFTVCITIGLWSGCATLKDNLSPPIASPTTSVSTDVDAGRDATVSTDVGIGGGSDSIALWLAILALAAAALAYPVGHMTRKRLEAARFLRSCRADVERLHL